MRKLSSKSVIVSIFFLALIVALPLSTLARVRHSEALPANAEGDVKLPENLRMQVELLSSITTKDNKEGDKFTSRVLAPEQYKGAIWKVILPRSNPPRMQVRLLSCRWRLTLSH